MNDTRYASRVFGAAGVFNVAVGGAGLVAPTAVAGLLGIDVPENQLFLTLALWLVLVMGMGYCLTARRPERNRDLMIVGAVGKLFVLPVMLAEWRRGHVGVPGVMAGGGDFVFALLFFDVLRRMAGEEPRQVVATEA